MRSSFYLLNILTMKFLTDKSSRRNEDYGEVEIKTLEELLEYIKKTKRSMVVIYHNSEDYWEEEAKGRRVIEDYDDYRE
jgi:hypothetical protein